MRATRASLLAWAGSAAAVGILAGGGVLATSAAADAASHSHARKPTTLSVKNKAIAHGRHHLDLLTGVLKSHRTAVAGESVRLEAKLRPPSVKPKPAARSAGSASPTNRHARLQWVAVGTAATGTDGSVSFTVAPSAKTQYKLVFGGDSTYRRSYSKTITLKAVKN